MKIIFRTILLLLTLLIFFVGYMTFFGLETKRLNNQIAEKVKSVNESLKLELKEIKLIFDPISFSINAKTISPRLILKNKVIEIENIKTRVSLKSLINNKFSFENLEISTKSLKVKDLVSFVRTLNNSPELFILEKLIQKGYLIGDIQLDFDENGKIKNNYLINGFVKDLEIDIFKKYYLKDINFIFDFEKEQFTAKDSSFNFNNINFLSEKISIKKKDNNFLVKALVNNNKISLSKKKIEDFVRLFEPNLSFENITFSSKNIFSFILNEKFKIKDLEVESNINLEKLLLKNNFDLKDIFPKIKDQFSLINHKINLRLKSDDLFIEGSGDLLFQEKNDNIIYNFEKNDKVSKFTSVLEIYDNPFNLNLLNYEKSKDNKLEISLKGYQNKKNQIFLNEVFLKEEKNKIQIQDLELKNKFKFKDLKSITFDYFDKENQRNLFKLNKKNKQYFLEGSFLNVNNLIEKILNDDEKESNNFNLSNKININIDEVSLDKENLLNNLTGNLSFKKNEILDASLLGKFSENKEFKLTIRKENNNKVTTLFIDKAEPIVKRYDFIKGFEGGKLDFYSTEKNKISQSKLKIYDFKLKEMPALTKILTLASLQGVADILSGEGIRFDEFEMTFQNNGSLMTITEIYAIGPAISILMEGYIEKNKLISLRGTLVPATTINKFIGSLPVLGEILVGKKTGEGVFGVSFKIKGPPKNLKTSVNPIKTLTPRFITRTLEKLKKN